MSDNNNGSFEVHLAQRNLTLTVPPDQTILKVLLDAGVEVPFSCSEGICGTCLTKVKEASLTTGTCTLRPKSRKKAIASWFAFRAANRRAWCWTSDIALCDNCQNAMRASVWRACLTILAGFPPHFAHPHGFRH